MEIGGDRVSGIYRNPRRPRKQSQECIPADSQAQNYNLYLHKSDIRKLLAIINRLIDSGNTVIVIEHNPDIIKNAGWIIDMGPEGGNKGGRVIFEGTPGQLLHAKQSITGAYLCSESAVLLE